MNPDLAVPREVQERPTVPIDLREMQEAAKRSRLVRDPRDPNERPPEAAPRGPHAELDLGGGGGPVTLPARNLSPTGVALEIPQGITLSLEADTELTVHLHLGSDGSGEPLSAQLTARVAHCREGKSGKPGGLALRWDREDPDAAAALERLLERSKKV